VSVPSQHANEAPAPGSDQADPAHELDSLARTIRLMIKDARDSTEGLDPENNVLASTGVKISQPEPYSSDVSRMIFYYHPNIIATQCVAITLLYIEQNVYGLLWVLGTI